MNLPKINSITADKSLFLSPLLDIPKPPGRLFYRGTLPNGRVKAVAIVGTRRPTAYGREVTAKLAGELAREGILIISGLALGIDAVAHQAALDAGGLTGAILGTGVDQLTPQSNARLGEAILASGGFVLSEYEPYGPGYASNFLERNRLVSGLALAVVVTEAALHSGTMSTVSHALDQGREVFAVPGPITSPMSAGTNAMIRSGASIVTSARDILNVLSPGSATAAEPDRHKRFASNPAEHALITLIEAGERDGDQLLEKSGLTVSEYSQTLTILEIKGVVRPLGGNNWRLA